MEKRYNLNIKKIMLMILISICFIAFAIYILFVASDEERFRMFIYELKFSIGTGKPIFYSVIICGIFASMIIIYMLELLFYKIKDVLVLNSNGLTYYAPEYKKVFIAKENIKDIYIVNNTQMKIVLNNYDIKTSFKAKFWTAMKDMILGTNGNKIFRINLAFINCDIKEIRELLMEYKLDGGSDEAQKIVSNICKKYGCINIEELKNNSVALSECIIKLYKLEKFTQVEIAFITKTNASKVSKVIRKGIVNDVEEEQNEETVKKV